MRDGWIKATRRNDTTVLLNMSLVRVLAVVSHAGEVDHTAVMFTADHTEHIKETPRDLLLANKF